jgi:hypothetical protein
MPTNSSKEETDKATSGPTALLPAKQPNYAKHTSSMKEIKSNNYQAQFRKTTGSSSTSSTSSSSSHPDTNSNEAINFKAKLMMNASSKQNNQPAQMDETKQSIQFLRPLKTSTALCLFDLTKSKNQSLVSALTSKNAKAIAEHPFMDPSGAENAPVSNQAWVEK